MVGKIVLMETNTSHGPNLYGDLPEIVVAASMMMKNETKTRVRVLVNLSSFSEILRSAWG